MTWTDLALKILPRQGRAALNVLSAADRPGDDFEDRWRSSVKRRVVVIVTALAVWATAVEARFVYLQVIDHDHLLNEAENRQQRTIPDLANRGEIIDRNGQILAYSVDTDSVMAVPSSIKQPVETTNALCKVFANCTKEERALLLERLSSKRAFAWVRRQVTPEEAAAVASLKLEGIGQRTETKRFYPKKELAAHLVGFVNTDSQGLGGIERAYNTLISGVNGTSQVQVDANRRTVQSRVELAPVPGGTVELTIDQYIQYIADRELAAGVEKYHAKGGSVVVMDPNTGEVLAESNYPTFNPNYAGLADPEERRNRAIENVYEPGSTFKIVTVSAAIEEGVFQPGEIVDTNPGTLYVPGRGKPITEAKGHNYQAMTFEDVLVHSSNVGAAKIGLKVGAERMERYIRRFGFGQKTGLGLAGESSGVVHPLTQLSDSSLASMSMGYEVSVTPMQMVTAVSAVANGGILYEPHVVRAVIRDGVRTSVAPKVVRRAISESTAAELTTIMERVVSEKIGTGNLAQIDGYQVAGKTGTAAKIVDRRYSLTDYNVSFAGFVPSRSPRLAILVMIDEPHNGSAYGGSVAAPIWKNIAEASLRQLGVPRTVNPIPPVLMRSAALIDMPVVNAPVVPTVSDASGLSVVPDVRGLSAREAVRVLSRLGLAARLTGSGVVDVQFPEAGAPLERGASIALQLKRTMERR
jgi:cell division protein FtsI (penicillin-binding protein 3)